VEAAPTLIPVPPVARVVTAQVAETAEEAKRENLLMVRSIHLRLGRRVEALEKSLHPVMYILVVVHSE
jgi:hypothetical protein